MSIEEKEEKIITKKNMNKEDSKVVTEEIKQEKTYIGRKIFSVILLVAFVVSGYSYYKLVYKYDEIPLKVLYKGKEVKAEVTRENIFVYVPNESRETLISKEVEIEIGSSEEERVRNILLAIKKELDYTITYVDDEENLKEIPFVGDDVQLLNVFIDGKDLHLNFNYHFKENMETISQEILILYSIVNTLTEDGKYDRIKFLVNNKEIENLNFYKLSDFYTRNLDI